MVLSTKYKFLFKHIPKTAGKSISGALFPYIDYYNAGHHSMGSIKAEILNGRFPVWHVLSYKGNDYLWGTIKHTREKTKLKLSKKDWKEYKKITCIRNPYSREVSKYFHVRTSKEHNLHKYTLGTFTEWVRWACKNDCILQSNLLSINGKLIPDYILRYENLNEDFKFLCKELGLPDLELPYIYQEKSKSKERTTHEYKKYYNKKTKALVKKHFKKDLDIFNYEFNRN